MCLQAKGTQSDELAGIHRRGNQVWLAVRSSAAGPVVRDVTGRLQRVMRLLELVKLGPLMDRTCGRPEIAIGLIDGPVAMDHPDLVQQRMQTVPGKIGAACLEPNSMACMHGTSVAGI